MNVNKMSIQQKLEFDNFKKERNKKYLQLQKEFHSKWKQAKKNKSKEQNDQWEVDEELSHRIDKLLNDSIKQDFKGSDIFDIINNVSPEKQQEKETKFVKRQIKSLM